MLEPIFAVIVTVPFFFAVTFPVELTVATDVFELDHVIFPEPVFSVASCIVPPTLIGTVTAFTFPEEDEVEDEDEDGNVALTETSPEP